MDKKVIQYLVGWGTLALTLILSYALLEEPFFFRMVIGLTFGYALSRGFIGFAGSVSRAGANGSTKLLRTLMFMFMITAIGVAVFIYGGVVDTSKLWVNPINFGLILGAFLFGFGMIFSTCCATGILAGASKNITVFLVTLFFFGLGILIGWPLQSKSFVSESWFNTEGFKGVYFGDFGLITALLITLVLTVGVTIGLKKYEEYRKTKGTHKEVKCECEQAEVVVVDENAPLISMTTYERLFVKSWGQKLSAAVLAATFLALTAVTGSGWGASTPYGMWVGKLFYNLGVPLETLTDYTGRGAGTFTFKFFENGTSVQNLGIILGAFIAMLIAGRFNGKLKAKPKVLIYASLGGFLVGFATRLSNGCNVGALYTPIANFSLSGWIFLPFMVVGGFVAVKLKSILDAKFDKK